ncbi:hypothetical protein BH09VER1_BH09VER1_48210 [soil metagenome]
MKAVVQSGSCIVLAVGLWGFCIAHAEENNYQELENQLFRPVAKAQSFVDKYHLLEELRSTIRNLPGNGRKAGSVTPEQRVYLYLRLIEQIDFVRLPDFKKGETFTINVAPPRETGMPAGVSPSEIKDPAWRAVYEDDIRKNAETAARCNRQAMVLNLLADSVGTLRRFQKENESKLSASAYAVLVRARVKDAKLAKCILDPLAKSDGS